MEAWWTEFLPDGTRKFVQSADLQEQKAKYGFSANLDSLYYLTPSGRKMDAFKIHRFTKEELTIMWPMGTATPDSVGFVHYRMVRDK